MSELDVITRLRRLGYAVRRSPSGEARAGRGARGRRPVTRDRLLPEVEQGAEAALFSCGWSLVAEHEYDFDGERRGSEPWAIVQYTLSGEGRLRRDGQEYALGPGTLLVLPLPDRHRYWLAERQTWEFAYVSLRGAAPRRAVARFLAQCGPVQALTADSAMVLTLLGTVADLLGGDSASPHAVSERAYAVAMRLLELADAAPEVAALPAPYADLPGWCRQRLPGLTVSDLAAQVGLSREHFSRHFRQVCGFGPGRWLSDLRQHAGIATLRGGGSLSQAASDAGLANVSVLRRALQRRLGWRPDSARTGQ